MEKQQATAIAAIICRVIDYWNIRHAAQVQGATLESIESLEQGEVYIAEALAAMPEDK